MRPVGETSCMYSGMSSHGATTVATVNNENILVCC